MTNLNLIISLAAGVLSGCILPYEPSMDAIQNEAAGDILVVEAMLVESSGTYVLIDHVRPMEQDGDALQESSPDGGYYSAAYGVSILGSDGSVIPLLFGWDSVAATYAYRPEAEVHFAEDVTYALDIRAGDKRYQSDYIAPMCTPPIDGVTYAPYDEGRRLDIRVSTHDPEGKAFFYLWRYDEDWEIHAEIFVPMRYDPDLRQIVTGQSLSTADNRYYCWGRERSNRLITGSAERMLGAAIKDHSILQIERSDLDSRFSYLYSILVRQYALPPDAYRYLNNLRKNTEETNSIFAPMPTEIQGNIWCIDDPNEPVVGYFFAATESVSRLYIDVADVPAMKPEIYCERDRDLSRPDWYPYSQDPFFLYMSGLGISGEEPQMGYIWRSLKCVDCMHHEKASKMKPSFWPNNHL
jgi:hypothetical protein